MSTLTCDISNFLYRDYVQTAQKICEEFLAEGVELILCLTHMRLQEDLNLARSVPAIDVILGGHDHFTHHEKIGSVALVKSGQDFRWLTKVTINTDGAVQDQTGRKRLDVSFEKIDINSSIPDDQEMKQIVTTFKVEMEAKMAKPVGETTTVLDCTRPTIRTGESTIGNWVCDILMREFHADVAFINSGTIASGTTWVGRLTTKSILSIFPYTDIIITARVLGRSLWGAFENSVSKLPVLEGRFLQISSSVRLVFDSSKPAGGRVVSVTIGGEPLDKEKEYVLATKTILLEGKDGYSSLLGSKLLMDPEDGQLLSLVVRKHFQLLHVIDKLKSFQEPVARSVVAQMKAMSGIKSKLPTIAPALDGRITDLNKK
eukprot:TRINITY_DN3572_c0_g2_i1.p1 TRINITY_DN3572_c0_g2~~TRINITY_DN3572_c0_g2_i1.p1  ORF type:complete len:373 (+),score=86.27 TRINITY_DN3572_c0_g2_i1:599-1717(+)